MAFLSSMHAVEGMLRVLRPLFTPAIAHPICQKKTYEQEEGYAFLYPDTQNHEIHMGRIGHGKADRSE